MPWAGLAVLGENFNGSIITEAGTGSPVDADSLPTYAIYEDGTNTAILSGSYAKLDDGGTTGYYQVEIACSTANGFERFKTYHVNSSAVISTVAVATTDSFIVFGSSDVFAASSGSLTTTSNFKDYANITGSDDDSLIAALISRATDSIQRFCDRTFISTTYREIRDGYQSEINTDNSPIISVQMYSTWRDEAIQIQNTSTDAYNAYVQIDNSTMTLVVLGGDNASSNELTLATYTTLTLLETAIEALGVGWTVTVQSDLAKWSAIELLPISGLNCLDNSAGLDIPGTPRSDYAIDNDAGIITSGCGYGSYYDGGGDYNGHYGGVTNIRRQGYSYGSQLQSFARRVQSTIIRYTAGYATTPGDLEQICIDLTKLFYDARKQNFSVNSEKIGDYSYKISDNGMMLIPDGIKGRLTKWQRRSF